jgi:hypothetical protein
MAMNGWSGAENGKLKLAHLNGAEIFSVEWIKRGGRFSNGKSIQLIAGCWENDVGLTLLNRSVRKTIKYQRANF